MQLLKVAAIAAAGLGVTWAAQQISGPLLGLGPDSEPVQVAQAEPEAASPTTTDTPAPGSQPDKKNAIDQLSEQEMADELARIEAASSGEDTTELKEFKPSRPLAADLAISLPSDI